MIISSDHDPERESPGVVMSNSIGSESIDFIVDFGDATVDMLISSGALDGVPVVGLLFGGVRAAREVREQLYFRKVARFLKQLHSTTSEQRKKFTRQLEENGELERFGETIMLFLDRTDDAYKPSIIGRIVAAHISGKINSYDKTMRLAAIANRAYAGDLTYLRAFRPGVQQDPDVAASLHAAGILANTGFDGGGADQEAEPSGYTYDLNEYGSLLVVYGLD